MNQSNINWRTYEQFKEINTPSRLTAYFTYFATGEGHTEGVAFFRAISNDLIRKRLKQYFDVAFCDHCSVAEGLILDERFKHLVPPRVEQRINRINSGESIGNFSFHCMLHTNYS